MVCRSHATHARIYYIRYICTYVLHIHSTYCMYVLHMYSTYVCTTYGTCVCITYGTYIIMYVLLLYTVCMCYCCSFREDPLETVRPERNRICALIGVPQPVLKVRPPTAMWAATSILPYPLG